MKGILRKHKRLFAAMISLMLILYHFAAYAPTAVYAADSGSEPAIGSEEDPILLGEDAAGEDEDVAVLAFTSDIHNTSSNEAANRQDSWLDKILGIYGKVDVMSFCGDMGSASANEADFWSYTRSVMNVVDGKNIDGVYTTGNHEFYNGKFSNTTNAVKDAYVIGAEGMEGDNFRIYCLGTDNWDGSKDNYVTDQITEMNAYFNSVGDDKPIIVLTHFPLHSFGSGSSSSWGGGGRKTANADLVIDALNAAANTGKKIVLLWGHNHTVSDTNYDEIFAPGREITYDSGKSKTISFYYGAAGCMSDTEYGSGSAFVKGKGLVITINNKDQLTFTYYDANANNVTEGGTFTEADPVDATAIAVSPKELTVEVGETKNLTVSYTPATTTNRKVTWSSSDTSVARVSEGGAVTGASKGTATITATYVDGGFTDTAEVTVTKPAGSGVTPEDGKKYVILAGDGYALTSEGDEVGYSNGSGDQQYNYFGLTGEEYTVGEDVAPDRLLWTFTASEDGAGYYIQGNDGTYLNGTYGSNETGGYDGRLKLDETKDAWVITGSTAEGTANANVLKSTNASQSDAGDKYLTHGNGDGNAAEANIFTLRSESNATSVRFYEYTDDGTYVEDPDDPIIPTPTEQYVYKLTDSFTSGKDYLIVSENTVGSAYALTNPGGTSDGASMGRTAVTVQTRDLDEDGVEDLYIASDGEKVIWRATANGEGFNLTNGSDYLEGASGQVKIFNPMKYESRYWTYTDSQLQHVGGNNTYTVYYDNGFTSTYNSTDEKIYAYEKVDGGTVPQVNVTGVSLDQDSITLEAGETAVLKATVEPSDATDKAVTWSSSDEAVATVKNGTVTAVAAGTAVITVTTADGGFTAECAVTVTPADEGTPYVLTETLEAGKKYVIASADTAGTVYILGHEGETAETYRGTIINEDGWMTIHTTKDNVVFEAAEITNGFSLTNGEYYMTVEGSGTLTFATSSSTKYWNYADHKLSNASSSATRYLTFSGTEFAGYYSSSNPNPSDIFLFEEKSGDEVPVAVTGVSLDQETLALEEGDTAVLKAAVEPANATNRTVTWASSDETVATVDNGIVTAVAPGTATITVTTVDGGFTAECVVTVAEKVVSKFVLTDKLEEGGEYLIVNVADVGSSSSRALKNPGGSADGVSISATNGKTTVTVGEGNVIETEDTDIVWTASVNGDGFYLTNNGDYLEVYQRSLRVFNPVKQGARYWTYKDGQLAHIGGGSPYYMTYASGTFSSGTEEGSVYLFKKVTDEVHTLEYVPAVAATCTEDGNTEYWVCTDCGKFFADEAGTVEIEEGSWIIEATGHKWDEGVVTTEPGCTEPGVKTYTCTVCGETMTEEIDPIGHEWGEPEYVWAEDLSTCTASRACKHDSTHVDSETVATTSVTKAPTCTAEGSIIYTAAFTNKAFTSQTKTVVLEALGHDWDLENPTWKWAKDGTSATVTIKCTRDAKHTQSADASITFEIIEPAKAKTAGTMLCTATAVIEGKTFTDTKTVPISPIKITGSGKAPSLVVKWTKINVADGYDVTYYKSGTTKKINESFGADVQKMTIKAAVNEKYKVIVKAYKMVDGQKVVMAASPTTTVVIKKAVKIK